MKKALFAISSLVLALAFTACGDSSSGASDSDPSNGGKPSAKGSFPQNGDPEFYCYATSGTDEDGKIWGQIKLNIPNYKGHVERITFDEAGNGTQYYEQSYYNLNSYNKTAMCLEFEQGIEEKSRKRNFTETHCENGVSYFVISFQGAPINELMMHATEFEEDCEQYKREWEDGEYEEYQKKR